MIVVVVKEPWYHMFVNASFRSYPNVLRAPELQHDVFTLVVNHNPVPCYIMLC